MMHTNCTFASLKGIKYGKKGFIGQARTFKTAVAKENIEEYIGYIQKDYHRLFSVYHTKKGKMFLALVCDALHPVWMQLDWASQALDIKKQNAKAAKKMAIAAKKTAEAQRILRMLPPRPPKAIDPDELPF